MIFDFHTHIFPEKIAAKTVSILKKNVINIQGWEPPAYTNATLKGLMESMKKNNITYSLVLPIATTVKQSPTINSYASDINGKDNIFSFGSVHPMQENVEQELEHIKDYGLKGIKLHPQYQNVYMDSPECKRVLKKCAELDLIVIVHAGADVGMAPPVKCTPAMIYDCMQLTPELKLIAAHMGGWETWSDTEKYLLGTDVYFDTSYSYEFMGKDLFEYFAVKHKHLLFGTDSPWGCQKTEADNIASLNLNADVYNRIMYENAKELIL